MDAASFATRDKTKLLGLIQNMQGDDDAELGAPDPAVYKSKSGGIVDTLTSMKDDAEAQLSEERKEEKKSQHNFDVLKISLQDEIAHANTEKDEAMANKAEATETKA